MKYDLTKSVAGEEDKEAIHCEFDVTDSGIDWLSGQICVDVILVVKTVQKNTQPIVCPERQLAENGTHSVAVAERRQRRQLHWLPV